MTKKDFRVITRLALLPACFLLPFGGMAAAQTGDEQVSTQIVEPLFDISPVFTDGTVQLFRTDGEGILLERRGDTALMKFESDPEIWYLTITPGPSNTELFKNDAERLFLRLSDRGNLSLYTADYPGEPLELQSTDSLFSSPVPETEDFPQRLEAYLSLRVGHKIEIEIESPSDEALIWMQDAASIAVKGMVKSEEQVRNVTKLRVVPAGVPDFKLSKDGVFTVYVDPTMGYEGRSSSDRVILFLKGRFHS